jgi:hypothetical protein
MPLNNSLKKCRVPYVVIPVKMKETCIKEQESVRKEKGDISKHFLYRAR